MSVNSKQALEGSWPAEAKRLRGFFDLMSQCLEAEYGEPLVWATELYTAEQWTDVDVITAHMQRRNLNASDGQPAAFDDASGVSFAHRTSESNPSLFKTVATMHWDVGGDGEWQFSSRMEFDPDDEDAKPLQNHSVEWLVHTLSSAAAYVNAVEATIDTSALANAMMDEGDNRLDEYGDPPVIHVRGINLAPHGIGDATLPASITAHRCPVGYPDGLILVPDMDRLINDPASLVDDLFTLDDILKTANPT